MISSELRIRETQEVVMNPANGSSSSASESLFQRRIEFHPARKPFNGFKNGGSGDFRVETLNPGPQFKRPGPGQGSAGGKKVDGSEILENGLDPELSLRITFRKIGAGLENLGNTCFLNSVLQCLTYTEPLAAYLQSGKHQNSCRIAGFCALCAIQRHVSRALQSTGRILAPKDLVSNLRCISRNFQRARQEDAHEYMVNLLESMHKCCLPSGVPSESPGAYEKSLVHKIFGGRLRSQVKCTQCSYCSNKFDPFLDLSLEILKADSLHKALSNFTAPELLDGGEKQYQCQRCKQKVRALKQLTVHKAPHVLAIHLKRFRAHDFGQKIDKKVHFGPTLDMKNFVSGSYEGDLKYTLYGVLVHCGWSTHSGHYYCFVRTSSGMWYSLDDNRVVQVSERTVLEQKAYMLFYVRDRSNVASRKSTDAAQKENINGNATGSKVSSIVNQSPKEQAENGIVQNKLHRPVSSGAVPRKVGVIVDVSKETVVKDASCGQLNAECLATAKDTQTLASSSTPSVEPFQSLASHLISSKGSSNLEHSSLSSDAKAVSFDANKSLMKNFGVSDITTSGNCNNSSIAKPLMNGTSQKNLVSSGDSSDKALDDKLSSAPPSAGSCDKICEGTVSLCSPKRPQNKHSQDAHASNDGAICAPLKEKGEDSGQLKEAKFVEPSNISGIRTGSVNTEALDCSTQRKLKKKKTLKHRVKDMHLGLKLFRTSLGLRKKKKQKKRRILGASIVEFTLDKDHGFSTDSGPSTSEKFSNTSAGSNISKRQRATSKIACINARNCNDSSSISANSGEFTERICQNGSALATDQKPERSLGSLSEAKQHRTQEADCLNDRKADVSQNRTKQMLTQGLRETTVEQWDDLDLSPQTIEVNHTEKLSIGYVLDEWDEEYDRGRRKKLKQSKHSFGGMNPFQEFASKKMQFKKAKIDRFSSGNNPFRI